MAPPKPLILIVDDESDSLLFLFDLLHSEGYPVLSASNGPDALDLCGRHRPGLVITDVRMPGMDGVELLRRIKESAPSTRVLLLSVYADWPMFLETLEAGGDDVLPKPFRSEDLFRAISRAEVEPQP